MLIQSTSVSGAAEVMNMASIRHDTAPTAGERQCLPPVVKETVEFYEIRGTCEKDLKQELRRKGIPWSDGRKYDSITEWEMKWDYGYRRGSGSCSVDSFKVDVDIRIRYPKWTGIDGAPASLIEKWEIYLRNLTDHEMLHRHHVVETAKELSRAVAELPPAETCAALDKQVQCMCNEKIKELQEYQERYDAVSGHGVAQGAVFH